MSIINKSPPFLNMGIIHDYLKFAYEVESHVVVRR